MAALKKNHLKKVLIITYYWPPSGGSSVLRWLKFVKYLREFGWEPAIFTPENPEGQDFDADLTDEIPEGLEIIKRKIVEPYGVYKYLSGQRKKKNLPVSFISEKKEKGIITEMATWIRGNLFIPDARKFWIKPSIKFLKDFLRHNAFNAIISTGPPHSMHLIALGITKKINIPWIADFRDPWTNIDFYSQLKLTSWADKKHHALEKKVLTSADVVVSVGPTMSREFAKSGCKNVSTITNGFDTYTETRKIVSDKKFSILHIGSMPSSRNPQILWQVLGKMCMQDSSFKSSLSIELIGNVDHTIISSLKENGIHSNLIKKAHIPHIEAIQRMKESGILLLVVNKTQNAKGILTNKFFEYLSAGRPIVAIGPKDGDVAAILEESGAGCILDYQDKKATLQTIQKFYLQYKSNSLSVKVNNIGRYHRKNLTASLAKLLDSLIV